MGGKIDKKHLIVTGFPYAFPYYWKVFEYVKNKEDFVFVLPQFWSAKEGKIKIKLEQKPGFTIYGARALSFGGKSLYGGLFKGWMPALAYFLPYLRFKYGSCVLYSCSEPNLLTTFYNGIFAKIFGYKHILFTWQNVGPEERMSGLKLKLSNMLVKLNLSLADGIVCGNKKAEEIIKKFDKNIITMVCPISGVDIEKFKPSNTKDNYILFYGALDIRKGVSVLIEAFGQLLNANPQLLTRLLIIGTGSEQENLKLQISRLKLENKVIFKDWMKNDELPAVLSKALVFIYPSVPSGGWEEQFGYAMAEASACAVPVVATKTGSIDEVVLDGKTGFLVPPNNTEALSEAIQKILSQPELGQKLGQAGREYVADNFSHEAIALKIENLMKTLTD